MKDLDPGYTVEVDQIDKSSWHDLLPEFDDATFYQTWSYGEKSWGSKNLSHLLLLKKGRVVAIAQLRILRYPFLKTGATYLNWGPLWRRRGEPADDAHLRNILRALRNEYVQRQNHTLRVLPKIFDHPENHGIKEIFSGEGYSHTPDHHQTFVVDLRPSLEELRQNLHKSWKGSLKFAEKQELEIFEASTEDHFFMVAKLNQEMKDRKHYLGGGIPQLLEINGDLPAPLKLKVLLCRYRKEVIAALGWSNIGKVCIPMVGGTGDRALQFKASFLLFWRMVQYGKEHGFSYCDMAGVHAKRNPGGYFFKKGLAGKEARETAFVGQFDAYKYFSSYLVFKSAMSAREALNNVARWMVVCFQRKAKAEARELDPGYRAEIDVVGESDWNGFLRDFEDATLYQTWAYGKMRVKAKNLSHVLLWFQNELVSISQVRITKIPTINSGMAYVHWGPLWKKRGSEMNLSHLRNMLRALRKEYVIKRRLLLRVLPKIANEKDKQEIRSIYAHESFSWRPDPDRTIFLDLSIPLENIRANIQKDWGRDLRNAEKQDLRIIEGTDPNTLRAAMRLVEEMRERKKYFGSDLPNLPELQENLSEEHKIRVMLAEFKGEPVAALGWQNIGRIGFPVIAATGDKGLKVKASFLLWWKMIKFYHDNAFQYLDVGGVNVARNPGGFLFKSRLAGKKNPDPDQYIGEFTTCEGRLVVLLFKMTYIARNSYKHIRAILARIVHAKSRRKNA